MVMMIQLRMTTLTDVSVLIKMCLVLQVCKTLYDTITEQKCEISYETIYDEVTPSAF